MSTTSVFMFYVIYQAWDAVFHHQMKHWEESWKYDAPQLDELRGVSSGDETLCQMLDITSQTKRFYQEKLRIQKWAFYIWFPNTHYKQTLISFVFFFMNYWWVWEIQMNNFNELTKNCSYVQMKNFNQNNFLFDVRQRLWSRIRVVSDAREKWNE